MLKFSWQTVFLWAAPMLFFAMLLIGAPNGMPDAAYKVLAATIWVSIWWIAEPVPIPATSLLPIIVFPLLNVIPIKKVSEAYTDPIVFLYIGGFILALAIEKWNLHKRIALLIVNGIGTSPSRIVLGFMLATGFISMWISNTATALMMLPLGMAIIKQFIHEDQEHFAKALLLSIAYASSIGGVATLIGTPTNTMLKGVVNNLYQTEISFMAWMLLATPIAIVLLLVCWYYLTHIAHPISKEKFSAGKVEIKNQLNQLGKISYEEKAVLIVFLLTALAWMTRTFWLTPIFPNLSDTVISLIAALILFMIPTKNGKQRIMDWETANRLPWGVVLLFGGGLALAVGFEESGLSAWVGNQLFGLGTLPLFLLMLLIFILVNFLTEITSNVATASMVLPILGSMALSIDIHPYALMFGACIAASCGFMLPVGTPPNAIVFSLGYLKMKDMVKAGFVMNLLAVITVFLFTYFLTEPIFEIDFGAFPESFKNKD